MKIAFCMRKEYLGTGGGGRIQILKTKEYLEKHHKHSIYIVHEPQRIEVDTDIVHIFNIIDLNLVYDFIVYAKKIRARTCLSTIYWDFSYFVLLAGKSGNIFGYNYSYFLYLLMKFMSLISARILKIPFYLTKEARSLYRKVLNDVDVILPNSIEEGDQLIKYTALQLNNKIYPIINAVEKNYDNEYKEMPFNIPNDFILEVGRIEPGKNQYMLVKALANDKELPIVLLGKDHLPKSRYSRELHTLAKKRGNVYFYDEIPYELVPQFYKKALIHVLPSLRESPGLVSLEALAWGCKAVVADSRFTPVDTYFGKDVTQINPLSQKSIREGIFREIQSKRNMDVISKSITEIFSWKNAAEQTNEIYWKLRNVLN
jgi:glycosyltransferase involved in cell wall biosynthesis